MIAAMAVLGIGGGFAGLIWGWLSAEREMRNERLRCVRYGWCEYDGKHSMGRVFPMCPCFNCCRERLMQAVIDWNKEFAASAERLREAMVKAKMSIDEFSRTMGNIKV